MIHHRYTEGEAVGVRPSRWITRGDVLAVVLMYGFGLSCDFVEGWGGELSALMLLILSLFWFGLVIVAAYRTLAALLKRVFLKETAVRIKPPLLAFLLVLFFFPLKWISQGPSFVLGATMKVKCHGGVGFVNKLQAECAALSLTNEDCFVRLSSDQPALSKIGVEWGQACTYHIS